VLELDGAGEAEAVDDDPDDPDEPDDVGADAAPFDAGDAGDVVVVAPASPCACLSLDVDPEPALPRIDERAPI